MSDEKPENKRVNAIETPSSSPTQKAAPKLTREEKLAAALKANIRRRKAAVKRQK